MNVRSKYFCYTLNNYTDDELLHIDNLFDSSDNISYHIRGLEVGESGTPHIQGYIEFSRRVRGSYAKNTISQRAHIERRHSSARAASDYCEKEGNYRIWGTRSDSEDGSDMHDDDKAMQSLKRNMEHMNMKDIVKKHFKMFLKMPIGVSKGVHILHEQKLRPDLKVGVIWGSTGTGKTRWVFDNFDLSDIWVYPGKGWFDGYSGQKVALFDDFSGGEFKVNDLLRVIDIYPYLGGVKCSHVWFEPDLILFTSNINPRDWYMGARPEHQAALWRRLHVVVKKEQAFNIQTKGQLSDLLLNE